MDENQKTMVDMANKFHDTKRDYFISTINLFLTICIGLVAFIFSSFKEVPVNYELVYILRFGLFFISSSIGLGILASYGQYKHFTFMALDLSHRAANMDHGKHTIKSEKWRNRVKWMFELQVASMFLVFIITGLYFAYSNHKW